MHSDHFDRILTTHTGSLPRPDDLAQMVLDRDEGKQVAGIDERIREAVVEIVRKQRDAGVDVVSDGEQSKISYATYIKDRLTGFEGQPSDAVGGDLLLRDYPDLGPHFMEQVGHTSFIRARPRCTGPITRRDHTSVQTDIANLKAAAEATGAQRLFMTAASPGVVAMFFDNEHYPTREAYLAAIGDAMREEYRAIVDAGLTLQLDCPDLGAGASLLARDNARRLVAENLRALNDAVRDLPPEQMRMHVCWGNYDGPHDQDVPLGEIVDLLLQARPAGLVIEAANPRHAYEWEVFQDVKLPDGKYLIPGVIESTNNFVEHPRVIAQRILNFTRLVGPERVMAGSDCGFGTFLGQGPVAPSIAWAKLRSLTDGARMATEAIAGRVAA